MDYSSVLWRAQSARPARYHLNSAVLERTALFRFKTYSIHLSYCDIFRCNLVRTGQ
jgi:hypothetical protein